MIIFKTDKIELDLSAYGVNLNEESSIFTDSLYKSFSLPFTIEADQDILMKLGLPNLDNISGTESKVKGKLILPDRYYNATLYIGDIVGDSVECDLSFGDEELAVYDLELKDLPWPIILTPDIISYANGVAAKSWPEVPCNFPMIYRPGIAEEKDYEKFQGFMNNYWSGSYKENTTTQDTEGNTIYHNINVLSPHVYLLEILRFIYALEGKTISGPAVDNALLRKTVYIPEKWLEKFRGSEFQTFSFSTPDEVVTENGIEYGIYKRQFTANNEGTYDLKFNINLDPARASSFDLKVYQQDANTSEITTLYTARSTGNRVKLEEELKINIENGMQFDYIKIELKLPYNAESISTSNQFELSFKDGRLNEFPSYFSLSDFMPDMTAAEYVNELKNWLNLDITIGDADVHIDFTQDSILNWPRDPHEHLEIPKPVKKSNSTRFYKLSYANNERIYYNRNGQIYSDLDEEGDDVIEIDMDVQPAVVEQNEGVITAVYPENNSSIDFCVYDGIQNNFPIVSAALTREMMLQAVADRHWFIWLRYRVNSKTFKESFECSIYETIALKRLSYKYHELHIIRKLSKKYLSEKRMRVEVESETL